jgi:sorting nexin-3/12
MSQQQQPTTARISIKPQTLREAYDPPANVLEIDVLNPETHGVGNKRYTDYEIRMRVN